MAEHNSSIKTLLESFCQKPKYIDIFPISSEEELISWEGMIDETNRDEMVKTVKTLLGERGITKGLVSIISEKLLLQYNMDGMHNKSRFKNFPKILQVFSVVHSTSALNDDTPISLDKNMRIAFKNAKNRHFKSNYDKKKRMLGMDIEEIVDDV